MFPAASIRDAIRFFVYSILYRYKHEEAIVPHAPGLHLHVVPPPPRSYLICIVESAGHNMVLTERTSLAEALTEVDRMHGSLPEEYRVIEVPSYAVVAVRNRSAR